jgi:hypothetical protein
MAASLKKKYLRIYEGGKFCQMSNFSFASLSVEEQILFKLIIRIILLLIIRVIKLKI